MNDGRRWLLRFVEGGERHCRQLRVSNKSASRCALPTRRSPDILSSPMPPSCIHVTTCLHHSSWARCRGDSSHRCGCYSVCRGRTFGRIRARMRVQHSNQPASVCRNTHTHTHTHITSPTHQRTNAPMHAPHTHRTRTRTRTRTQRPTHNTTTNQLTSQRDTNTTPT